MRDISEKKQSQHEIRQAEKRAAFGEMAAGMMHEINNPNDFIQGNAWLFKEGCSEVRAMLEDHVNEGKILEQFEDRFQESISDIIKGLERIQEIVNNLKPFAPGGNVKRIEKTELMDPRILGAERL